MWCARKQGRKTKTLEIKSRSPHRIGTLAEKNLHSALKAWYARPGDRLEAEVDGFHIDIVRRKALIEIQTSHFSSQKRKLNALVERHSVRLVFPIPREKWIIRLAADGVTQLGRRRSPKQGNVYQLFVELVSLPSLMKNERFSLEVLLTREEEVRRDDGQGSWQRKGWSISDRRLIEVMDRQLFKKPTDFLKLLPRDLPETFTTRALGESIEQPHWLAQKMAYCLRNMGLIHVVGKDGNAFLYVMTDRGMGAKSFVG